MTYEHKPKHRHSCKHMQILFIHIHICMCILKPKRKIIKWGKSTFMVLPLHLFLFPPIQACTVCVYARARTCACYVG